MLRKDYNWEVLIPLLCHYYPGRFAGVRQVLKRLHSIERLLTDIRDSLHVPWWKRMLGIRPAPCKLGDVEDIEQDLWDMTPREIESFVRGIAEIIKLDPMVDRSKTPLPEIVRTWWDQTLEEAIEQAAGLGLAVPEL